VAKQVPARNGGTLTRPDKGETMNPNGRPPKTLTAVNKELHSLGYKAVSNAQIRDAYLLLVAMDEQGIKDFVAKKETPMLVRIIGKRLLAKDGFEIIERLLDRALGRPQQKYDHTTKGEKITNTIDLKTLSDNELEILQRIKERTDKGGEV
jgi:hypothetical protein